jgi:hypothetical protein
MLHIARSSVSIKRGSMKNTIWMVVAMMLAGIGISSADTIKSVPNGGVWSATASWVGGAVPGASSDVVINGTVSITDSAACKSLTIADSAILQNGGTAEHVTVSVSGPITNNGTIKNSSDSLELWLELFGDVTNNGIWVPGQTYFAAKDTQTIAQESETEFGGALYLSDVTGVSGHAPLVAASELTINAKTFDFTGHATSEEWQGTLDMADFKLNLFGGTNLNGAAVYNSTDAGEINWQDSSTVSNCTFESGIMLTGICTVTDLKVVFNGNLLLSGTMQNGVTADTAIIVRFNGNVDNVTGTFRNNQNKNQLWLEMYGDLYNAGSWYPARTYIASRKAQSISMIAQSPYAGDFFTTAADGSSDTFPLVAGSDLRFYGSEINCSKSINDLIVKGKVDMAGYGILLQSGAYLSEADISNSDLSITTIVTCTDSAMVGESVFQNPVQVKGTFKVALQGLYFKDTLTVVDTLENGVGGCCVAQGMIFAERGIVNLGLIRDNPKEYNLWLQIGGNIVNSGIWKNEKNIVSDSAEQTITLKNAMPINALFQFEGMWPSEPYAWQKDGQDLANETNGFLLLDSLVESSAGVYRCKHGSDFSRTITVQWQGSAVRNPGKLKLGTPSAFGCTIASCGVPEVQFWVPHACDYAISLYDIRGKLVTSAGSYVSTGYHSIALPKQGLAKGTYTIMFRAGDFEKAMRFAIVR